VEQQPSIHQRVTSVAWQAVTLHGTGFVFHQNAFSEFSHSLGQSATADALACHRHWTFCLNVGVFKCECATAVMQGQSKLKNSQLVKL